jgi:diguanylate cyclase (GGDEF)-like protein
MLKTLLKLFLVVIFIPAAVAQQKLVLQLKWEHEFQFAGYYAALWQGYYRDAGIDLEILPASRADGSIVNPLQQIIQGKADFAIGAIDILKAKDQGLEPMILASIFQRSPSAVFSLSSTPIKNVQQLAKLRIAALDGDATKVEIEALFESNGFNHKNIHFVDVPINVESLINGKADAIVTYEISALTQAKEKQVELNRLHPADFGMDFYSDSLYSSKKFSDNNKALINKFVSATKKGWQFALDNKAVIAKKISNDLKRNLFQYADNYQYNLNFSKIIEQFVRPDVFSIGEINQQKWLAMSERLHALGKVKSRLDESNFYSTSDSQYQNHNLLITLLILSTALSFYAWYKKKLILSMVFIFIVAANIYYQFELDVINERKQSDKLTALRLLSSVSAKLKGNLETNLSQLVGFSAYISTSPNLTRKAFDTYAKEVFKTKKMLINFAAAKDLVVNYIYPFKGNESALGLDYMKNAAQKDLVVQVVKTGQLLVAGPVNLVQGGVAFIGRAPIFIEENGERKNWGIISAPIDVELLYQDSDVYAHLDQINIAIKSYDSVGHEGNVFFGDESTFKDKDRVELNISVGGGSWQLAATTIDSAVNNNELSAYIFRVRMIFIFATLLLYVLVIYRFRQERIQKAYENTIFHNQLMLEKVADVAQVGGWEIDNNFNITHWSEQASELLGLKKAANLQHVDQFSEVIDEKSFALLKSHLREIYESFESVDIELKLKRETDTWLRVVINSQLDEAGLMTFPSIIQDVTNKVKNAQLKEYQATFDSLTNLPNRRLFNQRLTDAIENAGRTDNKIAVLFIDLDRFKPVNDNHGHLVGDMLLIEAARRIQNEIRETDTVSRLSGDEFGVILTNIHSTEDASFAAEKILVALQDNYQLNEVSVYCGASIGISFYPIDSNFADDLIRKADQAMYEVKNNNRNAWQFYTRAMQQKSEYRHALLNELISVVNERKLQAYYQPIVELKNLQVVKCESLARWIKDDGSFVSPVEFIALAEESGLINRIDLFMLEQSDFVMKLVNQFQDCNLGNNSCIGVSINLSPRLFLCKQKELDNWLDKIKQFSKHSPVTIEITERLFSEDSDKAMKILSVLKEYGVKIALDDFGTGYSSLNYLVKFPVDFIKIDRSFVKDIGIEKSAETLIKTMLVMAKKLQIEVVAEGIETKEQLKFLQENGCDYAQGYYFAKPMPDSDFQQLLKTAS